MANVVLILFISFAHSLFGAAIFKQILRKFSVCTVFSLFLHCTRHSHLKWFYSFSNRLFCSIAAIVKRKGDWEKNANSFKLHIMYVLWCWFASSDLSFAVSKKALWVCVCSPNSMCRRNKCKWRLQNAIGCEGECNAVAVCSKMKRCRRKTIAFYF